MSNFEHPFHGDRPIETESEDRLGFGLAAKHVSEAIRKMASPEGFVIGIEGEWGSGKSSFINLVSDALIQSKGSAEIIRFLPWLISSREGLLKELFTEISQAAIRIDSEQIPLKGWKRQLGRIWPRRFSAQSLQKKRIKNLFSRFSSRLVQAGKVAELFGLVGAGVATEAGKRSIDEWLGNASLEVEKSGIQQELRGLGRKIVVFIDDLDRLEPDEVAEVLRLVRAVVDFPNVVFVLCYSREIIADNLSTALHIEKGDEFLEKIVQVSFPVPRPEAFDLRHMFRHELQLLYPNLLGDEDVRSRSIRDRLAHVIDSEGPRALLTPRHVVRAINALRFYATPVLDVIDIPDMVWLQLIRIQSARLHQWIEGYLIEYAARHAGAIISEEEKQSGLNNLNCILDEIGSSSLGHAQQRALISTLPGIDFAYEKNHEKSKMTLSIFGEKDVSSYIREKRLASPQHFRYYFALTAPQYSISDKNFSTFLETAQTFPEVAINQFAELATQLTNYGHLALQPLIDRLKDRGIEGVPEAARSTILHSLAESMDTAALKTGRGDWGNYWIWHDAENIFNEIWSNLEDAERAHLTTTIFRSGKSLGWLTDIFRAEIFSHGIYGNRKKLDSEWLLSNPELEIAANELLRRYRGMTPEDLDRLPRVAPILYAWMQYEQNSLDEIRMKVAELTKGDENFINFLERMRNWQAANGITHYPLKESNLAPFMDIEELRERLKFLKNVPDLVIAHQAKVLLEALVTDEEE